jgi:phosphatidylglycerol:prolipoprotein diacylglycerol transferase
MNPTLFAIGRWLVPTYTVLLYLGLALGLMLIYFEGKRLLGTGGPALDLGAWIAVGGILGGRIGFVLVNWAVFAEDWSQVVRIWEGGLSFHGALFGGLLALLIYAVTHSRSDPPYSFWELADTLTLGLAVAITFGWAACLMGACAYGRIGEGFGHMILPDLFGIEAPRFATQAAGLAYALVLFVGFWLLRSYWPFHGAAFLMYLLLYSCGMFILAFTRGDETAYLGSWRLGQWIDLLLAIVSAVSLLILWRRRRIAPAGLESNHGIGRPRSCQTGEQAAEP